MNDEATLRALFEAALTAARPEGCFTGRLPEPPRGRTLVLGAGKAAASMAAAFEAEWGRPCEGLVVTRYGHRVPTAHIEVVEAAHPVPDAAGLQAAERVLALAHTAGPDDLVVVLMSGGASALLTLPAGIDLVEKQTLNKALLRSGAPINVMNEVRKAVSAIKGGRLAAAATARGARLVTYLISDVPGDDPAVIGSGPTIGGGSDAETVLGHLYRYGIAVSPELEAAIRANRTPPLIPHPLHMIAAPLLSLEAAAERARGLGLTPLILGDALEGEAREVATVMAGIARSVAGHGYPLKPPCVLLSGGETTVTVRGHGRGGRNAEFLLALAVALKGLPGVSAIACDTDGIDGSEDNAGAWIDAKIGEQAAAAGVSLTAHLADNDAYGAFERLGRLVITGPTFTNVNDFRAILIR